MKFLRVGDPGHERPAALDDEGQARDLSSIVDDINGELLASEAFAALGELNLRDLPIIEGRLGSPIARPSMILCIGQNFADHAKEGGNPIPTEPVVFQKATNSVVGPYDEIHIPRRSEKTDWEIELGAVIGRECLYLEDEQAGWDAIAGYTVSHDVSEREFQLEKLGQSTKGKSSPTFNPMGPWLVTPDEVPDPMNLGMVTTVNEEVRQNGNTRDMIFNPGFTIYYLSQFMRLEPGDLINTGTPAGVGLGMPPGNYLKPGDVVELTITGLGTMRQRCVAAP